MGLSKHTERFVHMDATGKTDVSAAGIEREIRDFCARSPENSLGPDSVEKAWEEPLVGIARGDDPYFVRFKRDIGPFYWTPEEAFALAFAGREVPSEELSVVSYVLPQTPATRREQRQEADYPSRRWSLSREYGEAFNQRLRRHLVEVLAAAGVDAVAPAASPLFDYRRSERLGLASNWSERHTAFVAGLGTFGLSDGLITRRGKAMRCGSVVLHRSLPETPRPYRSHQEWCLYFARGTCGACIGRCPTRAISFEGHDKARCHAYIRETAAPFAREHFGVEATPCGLCQVAIPCEACNPTAVGDDREQG